MSGSSEIWLTPRTIFEPLGPFDLDPCAAPMPRPFPTARRMVALPENGLRIPWSGRVWCNPPYGRKVVAWMRRMAGHGRGTALTAARTGSGWFFETVWQAADAVLFLRGRVSFLLPDGKTAENAKFDSVLIAYGGEDADRLHASGLDGHFVPLTRPAMIFVAAGGDPTWAEVVLAALAGLGGTARLTDLYQALAGHPKTAGRAHWRAKVRQTVQRDLFRRTGAGAYALAETAE